MKIMVCGKGGCGKSTMAALLARAMHRHGKRVLLVDVDESNIGLYRMLGLEMPIPLMDYFGGKKGFASRTRTAGVSLDGSSAPALFPVKMTIDKLPGECVAVVDQIHVVSVGKIHHFGEGCACPMGRLFRMLFASLDIGEKELVIVDTAAGVEHFGRSLDNQCDHILCVVDPSYESIMMARKVAGFSQEMALPVSFVLNKVTREIKDQVKTSLGDISAIGCLPQDQSIFVNTLKGEALDSEIQEIDQLCAALMD